MFYYFHFQRHFTVLLCVPSLQWALSNGTGRKQRILSISTLSLNTHSLMASFGCFGKPRLVHGIGSEDLFEYYTQRLNLLYTCTQENKMLL